MQNSHEFEFFFFDGGDQAAGEDVKGGRGDGFDC